MARHQGLFVLDRPAYESVYAPGAAAEIASRVNLIAPPQTRATLKSNPELLADAEFIFSGWGCPKMDRNFLDLAPKLSAIFYAAGAINRWSTPALWERKITVTTANDANAIPVAEYTIAAILFSLKQGWQFVRDPSVAQEFRIRSDIPGNYKSTIGLVGMGTIARLVVKMLAPFHATILANDPFLTASAASSLGVLKADLPEIFAGSDVVSLHLAELPTTRGLIDGRLLSSMKPGATLINTARGSVINEAEMIRVLQARPDLQAVLDVTEHEPMAADSPLRTLPNVVLTPHIAGSQGRECQRMGDFMVEELDRYLAGQPLRWQVRPKQLEHSVHFVHTKQPTLIAAV